MVRPGSEAERARAKSVAGAVELDPAHLPAWLALGVSYTNNGNRVETYAAIHEWVERNERYAGAVREHRARVTVDEGNSGSNVGTLASTPTGERFAQLVQCLIAMARRAIQVERLTLTFRLRWRFS